MRADRGCPQGGLAHTVESQSFDRQETFMPTRVAINGFGRIGRSLVRSAYERGADLEIVAVNDVADAESLKNLLVYDSVFGRFPAKVTRDGDTLAFDGSEIRLLSERDPSALPWAELGVEVVIESTGKFRTRADAERHLQAGARKVILSAPSKGSEPVDANVVLGVNFHEVYDAERHHIITNASCTTNCLAPVAKVLHETVGIRHGQMTTVHAYTSDQNLLDGPHKDARRARAAAINLVPTSTGAAKALGLVIPELEGRLNGIAVRVPTPTGSLVDLTIEAERETSAEEINEAFRARADHGVLTGILEYSEDPIVSSDIVKSPYSSIFDAPLTNVMNGTQVKVVAWYDNEWGYATRMVELAEQVLEPAHQAPVSAQGATVIG
jgi:glyceraldehyde 3-phosphate dehydrogenase